MGAMEEDLWQAVQQQGDRGSGGEHGRELELETSSLSFQTPFFSLHSSV